MVTSRNPRPTPAILQRARADNENDVHHDATQPVIRPRAATIGPVTPQTAGLSTSSSSSVPSLRFPKPQGNRHLANWISRSDPDIMRITTTEEETGLGLADSTYELITTDANDVYADHPSESELSRQGDVHSAAGTDTEDDNVEHHDASDSSDFDETEDEDEEHGLPGSVVDLSDPAQQQDQEQEPESRSRAHSIEYTERSLQLPSSRTVDDEKEAKKMSLLDRLMEVYQSLRAPQFTPDGMQAARDAVTAAAAAVAPSSPLALCSTAISAAAVLLVAFLLLRPEFPSAIYTNVPAVTSTVTLNHTSTRTITVAPTASAPAPAVLTPFSGILQDLHDFGQRKNMCSAEITPAKEVLIKMPPAIKSTWLSKGAITLAVYRGDQMLKSSFYTTTEGIVIQLDRKDAHGTVNVSVITSRRPYVNETFELDFGKGALAEAWDAGVLLAYEIVGLTTSGARELRDSVESTAHAASGRVQEARTAVLDTVGDLARSVGSTISNNMASLAQEIKEGEVRAQMREMMAKSDEVLHEVDMAVVKAQIVSRLWFYKMTGDTAKHDEYSLKAKAFLSDKRKNMALAAQARSAAKDGNKVDAKCQSGLASWAKPECWKAA